MGKYKLYSDSDRSAFSDWEASGGRTAFQNSQAVKDFTAAHGDRYWEGGEGLRNQEAYKDLQEGQFRDWMTKYYQGTSKENQPHYWQNEDERARQLGIGGAPPGAAGGVPAPGQPAPGTPATGGRGAPASPGLGGVARMGGTTSRFGLAPGGAPSPRPGMGGPGIPGAPTPGPPMAGGPGAMAPGAMAMNRTGPAGGGLGGVRPMAPAAGGRRGIGSRFGMR